MVFNDYTSTSRRIVGNLQLDSTTVILYIILLSLFITIAPQGDALQKGTGGIYRIYTCCIAACLFGGRSRSVPCIALL